MFNDDDEKNVKKIYLEFDYLFSELILGSFNQTQKNIEEKKKSRY